MGTSGGIERSVSIRLHPQDHTEGGDVEKQKINGREGQQGGGDLGGFLVQSLMFDCLM